MGEAGIDGWLLYDFRRSNPLACKFLEILPGQLLSRRFFYFIPVNGPPIKIVSSVENPLKALPGEEKIFKSWEMLHSLLKATLENKKKIAMEYSPLAATPEISKVDAGTVELIRSFGNTVVSSGNLLQEFTCVWDTHKWEAHQKAAHALDRIAEETWQWITAAIKGQKKINEYDVQQWILQRIQAADCQTDHPPICAVNAHSADPHYEPLPGQSSVIREGDFILIDLWCKGNQPHSVYGDITRVGVAAKQPTEKQAVVFAVVKEAQDAAIAFVKKQYQAKRPMRGFEIDDVSRQVIEKAGYGEFFLHRTGHNIDESDHGPGAHIDNLETHDERLLLPGTCFSIEPGIYLKNEFGVRLECDVYLSPEGHAIVTGGQQDRIVKLL